MPSPFPGMDPYLEDPRIWQGLHVSLLALIKARLQKQLRPRYFVDVEQRVYVCGPDDPGTRLIVPDLSIATPARKQIAPARRSNGGAHAPAVLEMILGEVEVKDRRLEIRTVPDSTLITVIEVLSPVNKTPGSEGREQYLGKRQEVMRSGVHLVEIDLLRAGERFPSVDRLPRGDYFVHVSRAERRPLGEVWSILLRDPIPEIPIPVKKGDADARLQLGAVLGEAYDQGGYDVRIDYSSPPPRPALSREAARWALQVVTRSGRK